MGTYKFYWLNYTCDRCGVAARTAPSPSSKGLDKLIPRCRLCHRKLCGACYDVELCPEHHAQMQARTKEKLVATAARAAKQHKIAIVLSIVAAIWLLIEFFRVLDDSSTSLFGIPAWAIDIGALATALVYMGWQPGNSLRTLHGIIDIDPGASDPVPVQPVVQYAAGPSQPLPLQVAPVGAGGAMEGPAQVACPACGKAIAAGSRFCIKCGHKFA